jgi:hypothetical protein
MNPIEKEELAVRMQKLEKRVDTLTIDVKKLKRAWPT